MPGKHLLALALILAPAAAPSQPEPSAAYARHTNPVLTRFGSNAAFLRYIEEARAAAHARGRWWYGAVPEAGDEGSSVDDPEEAEEDPEVGAAGLEVIPGSHGDYDAEEMILPDGAQLFYSRLELTMIRPGVAVVWPGIRRRGRVRAGDEIGDPTALWAAARRHPLYALADIHRPVRDTLEPTVHAITLCPARALRRVEPERCRTTAFVGPRGGVLQVTERHAYLWTTPEYGDLEAIRAEPDCPARAAALEQAGLPAEIYRVTLADGALEVIGVRGAPAWGSRFHVAEGHLRAMAAWPRLFCSAPTGSEDTLPPARLTLVDLPLFQFRRRLAESQVAATLPLTTRAAIRIGFVGGWLLYGDLSYEFQMPQAGAPPQSARLFAVPLARPSDARRIDLPHNLVSIGAAGSRAFVTGYRDGGGLVVSILELGDPLRIVSAVQLAGRRQSTGHAAIIPARPSADGSVTIATPTVESGAPIQRCASAVRDELAVERSGAVRIATPAGGGGIADADGCEPILHIEE